MAAHTYDGARPAKYLLENFGLPMNLIERFSSGAQSPKLQELARSSATSKSYLARRHTISSTPAGAFGFVKRISSAVIDVTIRL